MSARTAPAVSSFLPPGHWPLPGDAVPAPLGLLVGPGRTWDAEPRWSQVEIRIGGCWVPGRLERWRLHQGDLQWLGLISWGTGDGQRGWYLYDPATVRQVPRPVGGGMPGPR